ncbi:hypothetical protein C8R47DRAFT_1075585 [Mycena vitilis]|nr:hypothetical protein C8R47DRAFT_1075585 [Mycena vitilis]
MNWVNDRFCCRGLNIQVLTRRFKSVGHFSVYILGIPAIQPCLISFAPTFLELHASAQQKKNDWSHTPSLGFEPTLTSQRNFKRNTIYCGKITKLTTTVPPEGIEPSSSHQYRVTPVLTTRGLSLKTGKLIARRRFFSGFWLLRKTEDLPRFELELGEQQRGRQCVYGGKVETGTKTSPYSLAGIKGTCLKVNRRRKKKRKVQLRESTWKQKNESQMVEEKQNPTGPVFFCLYLAIRLIDRFYFSPWPVFHEAVHRQPD